MIPDLVSLTAARKILYSLTKALAPQQCTTIFDSEFRLYYLSGV